MDFTKIRCTNNDCSNKKMDIVRASFSKGLNFVILSCSECDESFTVIPDEKEFEILIQSVPKEEKKRYQNDGTLYIGEGLENYYRSELEATGKYKVEKIKS